MPPPSSRLKNKPSKKAAEPGSKHVPPEYRLTFNELHGVVSQIIEHFDIFIDHTKGNIENTF
jgi:hypothetical protein